MWQLLVNSLSCSCTSCYQNWRGSHRQKRLRHCWRYSWYFLPYHIAYHIISVVMPSSINSKNKSWCWRYKSQISTTSPVCISDNIFTATSSGRCARTMKVDSDLIDEFHEDKSLSVDCVVQINQFVNKHRVPLVFSRFRSSGASSNFFIVINRPIKDFIEAVRQMMGF